MKLDEFAQGFIEEILSGTEAQDDGEFHENVFTETAIEYLAEVGECIDPEVAHYKGRGMKLNAWDLQEESDSIDLFISIFDPINPTRKVPRGEVEDAMQRATKFLEAAMAGLWEKLEESSPGFEPAQAIHARRDLLRRARVYLLTNGLVAPEPLADASLGRIEISHHVWDLERFYQIAGAAGTRQPIEITAADLDGGIPCVKLASPNDVYDAYVGVIPGRVLAALYEKWGQRLLERNVRSYLHARGPVNKGIQETIASVPGMFLAYNNGISTTADAATTGTVGGRLAVTGIRNLQVVNGGQTTASLLDAAKGGPKRPPRSLDGIYVQIKLTVLKDKTQYDEHVSLISRYANSQTKVNVSDFSANHPFHVALERVSRATWVPNPDTRGKSTTKWYYERARGQYINEANAEASPAKRRQFKLQYPTNQRLTKQLIAKYEMSWHEFPHLVSLGREKNFARFMDEIARRQNPDERYFRDLVAKAILFRETDALVKELNLGSHKANVVAYTIAWLHRLARSRVDLDAVWQAQDIDDDLRDLVKGLVVEVREHITNPPVAGMNFGEWAKKELCWSSLKARRTPEGFEGLAAAVPERPEGRPLPPGMTAEDEVAQVAAIAAETWFELAAWAKRTSTLEGWQRRLAFSLGRIVGRGATPTPRQALQGIKLYRQAVDAGFNPE